MRRHNITIAGMLGLIALVAIWLTSLRSASVYWVAAVEIIGFFAGMTALLGAIFIRGASRAFCLGFLLFAVGFRFENRVGFLGGQIQTALDSALGALADKVIPPLQEPSAGPYACEPER